jgi:predicted ATP-binding protein involved in virulence
MATKNISEFQDIESSRYEQDTDTLYPTFIDIGPDDFLISFGEDIFLNFDESVYTKGNPSDGWHDEVVSIDESDPINQEFMSLPECVKYEPSSTWNGIWFWQEEDQSDENFARLSDDISSCDELMDVSESSSSFEYRLEMTKRKLQETIKRSQETRQKLSEKELDVEIPSKRPKLERLHQVIESVKESANRLQTYLV